MVINASAGTAASEIEKQYMNLSIFCCGVFMVYTFLLNFYQYRVGYKSKTITIDQIIL